jgi:hypothetical protein
MLTYAFDLLYAIYEEEGYDATEIPALILTHNLTGVEIDDRAGALAAFALAMKAAGKLGRRRFLRMEAKPDICVLQNVAFTDAEMQDVAAVVGKDLFTDEVRETLGQFEQAKNFGSLIVPKLRDPVETLRVVEARDFGGDLLLKEVQERVVAVLRMAEALSPKYHVVVANPPYMGSRNMGTALKGYVEKQFPEAKPDLYAAFLDLALSRVCRSGIVAMVNLHNWMFISSYDALRAKLLSSADIQTMAHIGARGFDSIGGEVVSTTAFTVRKKTAGQKSEPKGVFLRLVDGANEAAKSALFKANRIVGSELCYTKSSAAFQSVPGNPIVYWFTDTALAAFSDAPPLSEVVNLRKGLTTMDNGRFLKLWSEVSFGEVLLGAANAREAKSSEKRWFPVNKGGGERKWYGLNDYLINWQNDGSEIKSSISQKYNGGSYTKEIRSEEHYFKPNITWSTLSGSSLSMRASPAGYIFESTGSVGVADSDAELTFALAFSNSNVINMFLEGLSPTLHFNSGPVGNCPVKGIGNQRVIEIGNCATTLAKSDWDAYETSWDFTTLPLLSPDHRSETLEDSYATLRAHWQSMTDEMQALEEENNRIFIDAYGLQDELTPEVPIEEITLTCNPAYSIKGDKTDAARDADLRKRTMEEFLSYAVGCMFGRYCLDAPGLILANQGETLADYLDRVPEPTFMPDEDNVIPVLDENWFSDDITERFRLFLRVTFGEAHFRENLKFIEDALGKNGKPRSLRDYFTKDFYADHVKRYKKRPIYWMFSSPKGTFNALIYMHRYRADTVSVLLNDYLREFITKLEGERVNEQKRSDDPTETKANQTKALKKISVLSKQINELNEWEREVIFPLAQRKIEIDLDKGVKANYPAFGSALKKITGLS